MVQKNSESSLPLLRIELSEAQVRVQEQIDKGKRLTEKLPEKNNFDCKELLRSLTKEYRIWHKYNAALLEKILQYPSEKCEYSASGYESILDESVVSFRWNLAFHINYNVEKLESILERLPLYVSNHEDAIIYNSPFDSDSRDVFIVHGRNNELKETVARFLEKLNLEPIILHEQPSAGRTIIEKFEVHSNARFAIILLTPDDLGCLASESQMDNLQARARQNVVFEWGFFVAKLGRKNVSAIVMPNLEVPSDMNGILCLLFDEKGAWKMSLAQEMKASGMSIDLNKAFV